jgi:hypothetical protein
VRRTAQAAARLLRRRRDRTTLIYADYAPGAHEVDLVNDAFAPDTKLDTKVRPTPTNSNPADSVNTRDID